jgi:hypothetical protein
LDRLISQGAGVNNAGHGRMLVRQLDDTRVTPGGTYEPSLLMPADWLWVCLVVQYTTVKNLQDRK